MDQMIRMQDVEDKVLTLRGQSVLLDADVAKFYGVETREINQAVRNNPDKFPKGYIIELSNEEVNDLRSKILIANISTKSRVNPKAFTEKGLYMLATILKGKIATNTTIAIIETFTRLREFSRNLSTAIQTDDKTAQNKLLARSGKILAELFDDGMISIESEDEFELNLAALKIKHRVKKVKKD